MASGEREKGVLQTLYYYACDCHVRVLARGLRARTELPLFYFSSYSPGSRRRSVTGVTLSGIPPALVTLDSLTVMPTRAFAPSALRRGPGAPWSIHAVPPPRCRLLAVPAPRRRSSPVSSRLSSPRSSLPRPSSRRADTALAKTLNSASSRGEAVAYSWVHDF